MTATKKYKLFKAGDAPPGGNKPVCAFFTAPDGCRNGDKCSFLHGAPQRSTAEVSETASVISSEESDAEESPPRTKLIKKEDKDTDEDPFGASPPAPRPTATPTATPTPTPTTPAEQLSKGKKRKARSNSKAGDDLFANPREKISSPPAHKKPKSSEKPKPPAQTKIQTKKETSSSVPDFRSLISKLPVASFSIEGVTDGNAKVATIKNDTKKEKPQHAESLSTIKPEQILPTSTEAGRKWVKAVKSSRSHERYAGSFDFVKYQEANQVGGITSEWIKAKPFGAWCASNPQVIAIDCEMCETQDPLSGAKNPKALCRLSVVNAENPEEVLLDTLVKPSWPVTDYRTRINGIAKEDLDSVEFTLRHAQAFMMALCSEETVIVGHAVQNDLAALFMEHYCVADSSFLFFAKDSTTSSVSLKDLVASIFKKEMPDTHDSVNDARKALECALHWVENDGNVDTVERTAKHKGNQLFIHRIPKQCKSHHLTSMFVKHTSVEPLSVDDIEFSGDTGKTHVTFLSTRHASLAFDTLEGTAEPDKSGRLQKKVYLRNGDYVRVRKMTHNHRGGTPNKTPTK